MSHTWKIPIHQTYLKSVKEYARQDLSIYIDTIHKSCEEYVQTAADRFCCHIVLSILIAFLLFPAFFIPYTIYMNHVEELIVTKQTVTTQDLFIDGFMKTNHALCPHRGVNTKLLILVASAPGNHENRLAIRRTWGSYVSRADVSIAFVLGQPLTNYTRAIEKEDKRYRDLIVGKFLDTYRHLTLKTLLMFKWAQKYCSKAKYLLKVDDDFFVNVPAWLSMTDFNSTKTIWGYVMYEKGRPIRNVNRRYYVSKIEYPRRRYPFYASGSYMMSLDCVNPILEASFEEPYLYIEDVFVTGLIAEKVGISRRKVFQNNESMIFYDFLVHGVRARAQYAIWYMFTIMRSVRMGIYA